jgi:hypothetical protein
MVLAKCAGLTSLDFQVVTAQINKSILVFKPETLSKLSLPVGKKLENILDVFYVGLQVVLILLLRQGEYRASVINIVQQLIKRMGIPMDFETANKFACPLPPRMNPLALHGARYLVKRKRQEDFICGISSKKLEQK